LHQDAVNLVAFVQLVHPPQQVLGRDGAGQLDALAIHPQALARFRFVAGVNLRGRVVAHQDHRETRADAHFTQLHEVGCNLRFDLIANFIAVQNPSRHRNGSPGYSRSGGVTFRIQAS